MEDYPKMMMIYESGLDYKTTMDTWVRTEVQNDTLGPNIYHAHYTHIQTNSLGTRDQS